MALTVAFPQRNAGVRVANGGRGTTVPAAAEPRPQGSASPPSIPPLARHSGVTDTAATVAVHGLT
eukprot:COSAG01_NODE_52311_length_347_cov_1.104839_1_plen_64_part_01